MTFDGLEATSLILNSFAVGARFALGFVGRGRRWPHLLIAAMSSGIVALTIYGATR